MSDPVRTSLGAYLLGALDPAERARVQEHLATCTACGAELASLAGLPGLLARLDPADLNDPDPDPGVLARTLAALVRRRRRTRRRVALAVAAGSLAALVPVAVAVTAGPPAGRVVTATDQGTGTTGSFALHPRSWGTSVDVRINHVPYGAVCRLVAVDRQGVREVIGSWSAGYRGEAVVTVASALPVRRLAALEVVTTDGARLLRAPIA